MARVQPILIVDGDSAMRETLREQLTRDGAFSVVEAGSAQEAEAWLGLAGARCAAVIMDAMLPDADGHAVRARLRANGLSMPIILLNGQDAASGEDDMTIAKPFRLSALMTRLRASLDANPEMTVAATIRIGRFDFNPVERVLCHAADNRRVRLTEKEAAILAFLHRMGDKAASRRDLLRDVWGYNPAVTTHTLETHIYRLRQKIEADPARACLLVTEAGGYRLVTG